ncbi:MAG: gamma-glutamyltransferase family protein [Wenzhouxiangella sp.]|jgi:gamma-glutamyltranspeptidase/glutathione hydrolase|nr:gamma-glutamyltransferase family protein [Wenzhouxiangella sp.]
MADKKEPSNNAASTRALVLQYRVLLTLLFLLILVACASPRPDGRSKEADQTVDVVSVSARGVTAGVAAAHPMAVEAGLGVLARGGSAADAAVAVQAMLSLVEPQSSGIGGGAFLLHYAAETGEITAFNGRETAPAGATPDMFINDEGEPLGWFDAIVGGRAVGVPGVMPMLGEMQQRFGVLPWSQLFDATITAAEDGFEVPQRLARFAAGGRWPQAQVSDVIELFTNEQGETITAGEMWRNPAYGQTLRRMAEQGPRTLLEPPISTAIIERTSLPPLPGTLVQADFDAYRPGVSEAVCGHFLKHRVCVPPPPSSGVALLQMLAILEHTDIDQRGPNDPVAWLQFAEASRLMYADRNRYVADPAFVEVPVAGLLDPDYVADRAATIGDRAGPLPDAGTPPGLAWAPDDRFRQTGTSHFVVIDDHGNVVTMTTSVESIFGTGRTVGGFFLNNQLTDFSFRAEVDGVPVANAVAPGKRPRSSMSPVLVLDKDDRLVAALGSPGGSAILAYNAKTIVGLLAWNLSLQEAIDLPNLVTLGENYFGEASKFPEQVLTGLAELGIEVRPGRGEESGLHGVVFFPDGRIDGAADPRREGAWQALGN